MIKPRVKLWLTRPRGRARSLVLGFLRVHRRVRQAVEGHGRAPGPHHGQQDKKGLPGRGQPPGPHERPHEGKRQRKHGVLDFDHLQDDLDLLEK